MSNQAPGRQPDTQLHRLLLRVLVLWTVLSANAAEIEAQEGQENRAASAVAPSSDDADRVLLVGTKEVKPFAFKDVKGEWKGISIDLWTQIAAQQGWKFEWREAANTDALIQEVADGNFDIGIAAITMKPGRSKVVDFSNAMFSSGLGIATRSESPGALSMLSNFISWNFFRAILTLVAVIAVFGVLIWLLERKRNPEMFETDARRGLMSGFWWSAVTMTTVGYGDKSPVTGLGRLLAVVWMFASIITISGLTATIAASLTTQQLESRVRGPEDLPNVRVGAKQGESPAQILRDMKIEPTEFDTIQQGLNAVKLGVIDAFVHDVPVMQAEIKEDSELGESVLVLHRTIQDEEYGIAVHRADPTRRNLRREQINESLLDLKISGTYGEIVEKYLGSGG